MDLLMSLVDFIPVIMFLTAAVILQRDLYHKMSKGAFSLFSAGTITVVVAGTFKALWKLLFNLGICDFAALNTCFFPMQTTGFFLAAAGLLAALVYSQGEGRAYCVTFPLLAAPMVYTSNMIFVILMVVSVLVLDGCLCLISAKRKSKASLTAFILAFFGTMMMGYLSSRDFTQALYNWIAEGVNVFAQGMFLLGAHLLHKTGIGSSDVTKL